VFRMNSGSSGGAVFSLGSTVSIVSCQFMLNTAKQGGGLLIGGESFSMTNSSLVDNAAVNIGGGLLISLGYAALVSYCEFVGNKAANGGLDRHFNTPNNCFE
jgi:hypothetical protein